MEEVTHEVERYDEEVDDSGVKDEVEVLDTVYRSDLSFDCDSVAGWNGRLEE
jgi:hypothetical protein